MIGAKAKNIANAIAITEANQLGTYCSIIIYSANPIIIPITKNPVIVTINSSACIIQLRNTLH